MLGLLIIALATMALFMGLMFVRRADRLNAIRTTHAIAEAKRRGSDKALLQHPHIDRTRCMGCGLCVLACPEDGVLDVVFGQARVVHGARCVGHALCADACPTDAIAVALSDLEDRRDLPALEENLAAIGAPNVYLAGEVTGLALIKTAIAQGTVVGADVARRFGSGALKHAPDTYDLLVVGAGPAGLACVLKAREAQLNVAWVDQESLVGGTVAKYPRRKLVMTQPVTLPLHGLLRETRYEKEDLTELWTRLTNEHDLPFQGGIQLEGLQHRPEGGYDVLTNVGPMRAQSVCLALGRRGVPRKLGVPGEELNKVTYSLIDARSYAGRQVLVVGGGDSAIEAALGLAAQPGTSVSLSYRREAFFRLKADNESKLEEALSSGKIQAFLASQVQAIEANTVALILSGGEVHHIPNDDVFVLVGGTPPFPLLEKCGVSFDPTMRKDGPKPSERGSGLAQALTWAMLAALAVLLWAVWRRDYYVLSALERSAHEWHDALRPARNVGLIAGVLGCVAILANLSYLLRRTSIGPIRFGALRKWMSVHVATGIGAGLLALLHCGFTWHGSPGGIALIALGTLIGTGAMGRYLYAFLPRSNTGRELALDELQSSLVGLQGQWEGDHPEYREWVQARVVGLVDEAHWSKSFLARLRGVLTSPFRVRKALQQVRKVGREQGVPTERVEDLIRLAKQSHRLAMACTWHEELRALLSSWRYLHRWVAVLLVLVVTVHVVTALRYARIGFGAD